MEGRCFKNVQQRLADVYDEAWGLAEDVQAFQGLEMAVQVVETLKAGEQVLVLACLKAL